MGRSKAQDALMAKIQDIYPQNSVVDEVFIGDLIKERGYSINEISAELGHKPHKMFVDIVMRDIDKTVAFEYHGEQHYSLVGNMTKTNAELLMNQELDREKSWILDRIGVPLVTVPFDFYIDEAVIDELISTAENECLKRISEYVECPECGRLFPIDILSGGICQSCYDRSVEKAEKQRQKNIKESVEKKKQSHLRWTAYSQDSDEAYEEYKQAMKQQQKEYHKAKREEMKASPEYQHQKELARQRRKEAYQKAKARRKNDGIDDSSLCEASRD